MKHSREKQKNAGKEKKENPFLRLPLWIRVVIINGTALCLLLAVFYMTGSYLYGPAKTARAYYEAKFSEDWNRVYDNCRFPDSKFLSRKIFVNANSYQEEGTKKENRKKEITSYILRKKQGDEERSTYKVNYSLKGDGEAYSENLIMTQGESVLHWFHNWYVLPEDLYLKDIKLTVPRQATVTVDGISLSDEYLETPKQSLPAESPGTSGQNPVIESLRLTGKVRDNNDSKDGNLAVYKIPYMFRGNHTIELKETGKDTYQGIFEIDDQNSVEVVPELALSNESGREIGERAEQAVNDLFKAVSVHRPFSKVSGYVSEDDQKHAKTAYKNLESEFSTNKKAGITTLSVTRVTTSVKNKDDKMSAEIEMRYTIQEVKRRFFFFYKEKNYSDIEKLKVRVTKENGQWVFDEGIIPVLNEKKR